MKRGNESIKRSAKSKSRFSKASKALALSQVFSLVIEIFAVAFIFGGMSVVFGAGSVSGQDSAAQEEIMGCGPYDLYDCTYIKKLNYYEVSERGSLFILGYTKSANPYEFELLAEIPDSTQEVISSLPAPARSTAPAPLAAPAEENKLPESLKQIADKYNRNLKDLRNKKSEEAEKLRTANYDADRAKIRKTINDLDLKIEQQTKSLNILTQDATIIDKARLTTEQTDYYLKYKDSVWEVRNQKLKEAGILDPSSYWEGIDKKITLGTVYAKNTRAFELARKAGVSEENINKFAALEAKGNLALTDKETTEKWGLNNKIGPFIKKQQWEANNKNIIQSLSASGMTQAQIDDIRDFKLMSSSDRETYLKSISEEKKANFEKDLNAFDGAEKEVKAEEKQRKQKERIEGRGEAGEKTYKGLFGAEITAGPVLGRLWEGLGWATGVGTILGVFSAAGVAEEYTKPLAVALPIGIIAGKLTQGIFETESLKSTWLGRNAPAVSGAIGLLIAYFIFASKYEDVKTKEETIEFKCMPWQAPAGGANCEKCNDNPLMPCSEYRCKALGQTCKLINAGSGSEKCIDSARDDVTSPGIKPDRNALALSGYQYANVRERPPGGMGPAGMRIVNPESAEGCLKAFTPFTFGIITTDIGGVNQPAECKIEYNHTAKFDDMGYWMGGSNLFVENHSETVSLPGTYNLNKSFPGVKNDGEYNLYIRCKDGNGNENRDEFVVSFCVDKTPDLSAPIIKATSIPSSSPVLYKIDNVSVNVYTNEPAKCKWSRKDASYLNMENNMTCPNNVWEMNAEMLYTCTTTLTGVKDKEANQFYFRCEDMLPNNSNVMQQSYPFTLIGTQPLTLLSAGPSGTISSATTTASVNLTARTDNGFRNGEATCYYSPTGAEGSYIAMIDSGNVNSHKQPLDLAGGSYIYYIKCIDLGGNTASNTTSFEVYIDKSAPVVARAYSLEGKLIIITDEASSCRYSTESCNFDLSKSEGIDMPYSDSKEHYAEWKIEQNYFIKCSDKHGNSPEPSECSVVIRPYSLPEETTE